jgi:hypothetical protein
LNVPRIFDSVVLGLTLGVGMALVLIVRRSH